MGIKWMNSPGTSSEAYKPTTVEHLANMITHGVSTLLDILEAGYLARFALLGLKERKNVHEVEHWTHSYLCHKFCRACFISKLVDIPTNYKCSAVLHIVFYIKHLVS